MVRAARIVIPGLPHHVTQRGIRRLDVFFSDDDYRAYIELLARQCAKAGTALWGYCLMPNHIHLILVPGGPDGLRAALAESHRRYAARINERQDWRGHLWQERFHSFAMDERHLLACARYVELNPVRAGLVERAEDWPWSSARAHLAGRDDDLATVAPLLELAGDWPAFLAQGLAPAELESLRGHSHSGRPAADPALIARLGRELGRPLSPRPRGRPRKQIK